MQSRPDRAVRSLAPAVALAAIVLAAGLFAGRQPALAQSSPPTVSAVSPGGGAIAGGTRVTITGTNFSTSAGATSVAFGAAAATSVSCSSTTSCTATSPAGSGTVDVRVTVNSQQSAITTADQFTYLAAVQQSSPANGATGQSTSPTLAWTAPSYAVASSTQYTVSLKDAAGHALANLPATTSTSVSVPTDEQLQAGVSYSWNVAACNGSACSGPNSTWYRFTTAAASNGTGTLGSTTIGAQVDSGEPGSMNGSQVMTGGSGATVQSLSVYVDTVSAAPNNQFQVAVYSDNHGVPSSLVAHSASATLTANSWNTVSFSTTLSASTSYWLLYNSNGATGSDNNLHFDTGSHGQGAFSGSTAFGTWPQSFGAATTGTWLFSIYATLSSGGGGPTTTPGTVQQSAPANGAQSVGQTPTLSWSAPSGAVSGTTTYTVSIWDPFARPAGQTQNGQKLADLAPTTALSAVVPGSEGLLAGHSYRWNVSACNGQACSAYNSTWFLFSTSASPNTATQSSPANGATGQSITPTLNWNPPANAIPGTTTYTVSVWDPYGGPAGHLLGDLAATTATATTVPAAESLYYGQQYDWNVNSCNGSACSGYNSQWFSFTTMPQPAATLSGAVNAEVSNADFAGAAVGASSVPGWTGGVTVAQDPGGFSYLQNLGTLSSAQTALDFPSRNGAGSSVTWFRVGARLNGASSLLTVLYNGYTVLSASSPTTVWGEYSFAIPAADGSGGQLMLQGSGHTTANQPDVAYLQRLDGPAGRGGTQSGLASGNASLGATDLALPGVMGLSFRRSYGSQSVSTGPNLSNQALSGGPLGPKWWHNWQYRLFIADPTSTTTPVAIELPGGAIEAFTLVNGSYVPPAGVHDTLSQNGSSWTLTTPGQTRYRFSGTPGTLTSVTDRNGNSIALSYDPAGNNLTKITDPGGRSISLSYTGSQLTGLSDSAGRSVGYSYSTAGDLATVTDVRSGVTRYQYTGHLLTQVTDPLNHVVLTNGYDTQARLATQQDAAAQGSLSLSYATPGAGATQLTDQLGHTRTSYFDQGLRSTDLLDAFGKQTGASFDADNNLMSLTDPVGQDSGFSYDSRGNRLSATDAEDFTSTASYDSFNDPLSVTDRLGNATTASYDSVGNLQTVTDPLGNTKNYTVNSLGQATAVKDGRGNSTSYGYSAAGDRTTITDALTHTTTIGYDSAGRPTSLTDALNHASSASYDAAGQQVASTDALNHTTSYGYDADGRRTSRTDANTHQTTFGYDNRGLLTAVIDPVNGSAHPTSYGYDAAGRRTSVTDAGGHATSYSFDSNNRPLTVTDPLTNVLQTLSYDDAGRVLTRKDAKNQTTSYSYTPRGGLASIGYADGTTVGYQYDAQGRRVQMTDSGGSTSYTYNNAGRLVSVTSPGPHTVWYGYDAAGNRTSITYPNGTNQVSYAYDQDNRLASVTDWNRHQTSYSYDNAGRLSGATLPSGTTLASSYSYDNANRLLSITHTKGGGTVAYANYTLDAAGNRTSKSTEAQSENYVLDALNRLTSVTPQGSAATTYTYDPAGNRLTLANSSGTTSYAYNAGDELTSVTPPGQGAVANSFDGTGSQTARGSDSFSWDAASRLSAATIGGQTSSFAYNGDNLRVNRTSGVSATSFIWDVGRRLPRVLDDGTWQYVYGQGSGPIARIAKSDGLTTQYYLADGLGSTLEVKDSSGNLLQEYSYDAFGAATPANQNTPTEFTFAGQQTDPSGLQYLRARYYDPTTGRFLSRDSLSFVNPARFQPYAYASNNPALVRDPSGRCDEWAVTDCLQVGEGDVPVGPEGYQNPPPELPPVEVAAPIEVPSSGAAAEDATLYRAVSGAELASAYSTYPAQLQVPSVDEVPQAYQEGKFFALTPEDANSYVGGMMGPNAIVQVDAPATVMEQAQPGSADSQPNVLIPAAAVPDLGSVQVIALPVTGMAQPDPSPYPELSPGN